MDLIKIDAPSNVELEGVFFEIKTDFRDWLKFGRIINNEESTLNELFYLFPDKKPKDLKKILPKLIEFYNPPQLLPRPTSAASSDRVLDYDIDGDLIYAAFMEQYKIDLFEKMPDGVHARPLHWHKFQALLNGLHDTRLNEVMGYRAYNPNDKTEYKKQMINLKNAWKLPQKESKKNRQAREEFNALFEKKNK